MTKQDLNRKWHGILSEAGAIVSGHFVYTAGDHGNLYVAKDLALTLGSVIVEAGRDLAAIAGDYEFDVIVGPELFGAIVASHVVTEQPSTSGIRVVYARKAGDGFEFRGRHKKLIPGKRVAIFEDVINTGKSVCACANAVRKLGGEPIGIFAIFNRGESTAESLGVPVLDTLAAERMQRFSPEECLRCGPGSRGIPINTDFGHGAKYLEEGGHCGPS